MQTFGAYLVALLAASAELASGLPQRMDTIKSRGGQTLSVPVKRNTVSKKHPAVALAKVYAKYGKEMPTRLKTIVRNHRAGVGMALRFFALWVWGIGRSIAVYVGSGSFRVLV